MPPHTYPPGATITSTYLTPTSDNRAIPQRRMDQQPQQRRQPSDVPVKYTNGVVHRRVRPLTVDEALQYSSLSSIAPHNPGENLAAG